ncbi:MAG: helix-turn-helix domain-containing protein [Verrucomicrobiia bacterium]
MPRVGLVKSIAVPPIRITRRLAGLSRGKLAAVIGFSERSIQRWERGEGPENRMAARAARLLYLAYMRPDPQFGWLRACLGLAPNGALAPELKQKFTPEAENMVRVPGYCRARKRAGGTVSESVT